MKEKLRSGFAGKIKEGNFSQVTFSTSFMRMVMEVVKRINFLV